jgi:uncharacterized glyoxalase superfamily protein PhnB
VPFQIAIEVLACLVIAAERTENRGDSGARAEPSDDHPWGMRDFTIADPTGVLWRIAQITR